MDQGLNESSNSPLQVYPCQREKLLNVWREVAERNIGSRQVGYQGAWLLALPSEQTVEFPKLGGDIPKLTAVLCTGEFC